MRRPRVRPRKSMTTIQRAAGRFSAARSGAGTYFSTLLGVGCTQLRVPWAACRPLPFRVQGWRPLERGLGMTRSTAAGTCTRTEQGPASGPWHPAGFPSSRSAFLHPPGVPILGARRMRAGTSNARTRRVNPPGASASPRCRRRRIPHRSTSSRETPSRWCRSCPW